MSDELIWLPAGAKVYTLDTIRVTCAHCGQPLKRRYIYDWRVTELRCETHGLHRALSDYTLAQVSDAVRRAIESLEVSDERLS